MSFYQCMRVMKITMVFLTCLLMKVSAFTYGQRITLNKQNSHIPAILKEIRQQSGYDFFYDNGLFNRAKPVNVNLNNATVEEALNICFAGQPFGYVVKNKLVVVTALRTALEKPADVLQQRLAGRVIDQQTKRTLASVSIRVKGTSGGTNSDANGNFSLSISKIPTVLVLSYLGYQTKEIEINDVKENLVIGLNPLATALEEVTVQARRKMNTETAVLEERKRASIVQDAISAELIERTASITTTQALQRVTGVTVTDDKYVAIRGLGDRSVIGQLNGVRLASSDPDRSAIPLDLVPASLLDNITVYKTVTPDKPADAASGIVELKTKSVPEKMTFELIAQTGLNSNIGLGGNYNSFWNSEMGLLGTRINKKDLSSDFLNLATQYPNGLSSIQDMIANSNYSPSGYQEVNRVNTIMKGFDPVMTTRYRRAPMNQLYSATFGNSYDVFGKHKLGLVVGGNYYRRTADIYQGELTQYSIYQGVVTGNPDIFSFRNIPNYITPNSLFMGKYQTYSENTGTETLNYGTLVGVTYRFNPQHEISMQYLGSWGGESIATNLNGRYEYSGLPGEVRSTIHSLKQTFRNLNTFNLQGEHKFLKNELSPRLSYNVATSKSTQNDPDFRFASLVDYKPRGGGWYRRPIIGEQAH